ncbi:TetR/AcrR family transcriptional regulator [Micromonosporaceae bacterium Da 78-11]
MSLRERKQQRAREQIIEAAYALFAERGFTQVTVSDIAERAEVGRTTFFRYFGDKQEVVFADEQQLLEAFAAVPVTGPAPADLPAALEHLWDLAVALGGLMLGDPGRYAEHELLVAQNQELQDRGNRKLQRVAGALESALLARGAEPELAVLAAQVAVACFRAAQRSAGEDPDALMPAMRRAVDRVVGRN